jgi:hypothetical protein
VAIIVFKCPFCGKKVETPEDNVGREGLCPGCQKIFEIPEPAKREATRAPRSAVGIGFLAGGPPEYQELGALIGATAVLLGLLFIAVTTFLPWVQPGTDLVPLIAPQKGYILFASAACFIFMAISVGTRKSLVPALLSGAGWGMFALIWIGSLWHMLGKAHSASSVKPGIEAGLYLAVFACLVAIAGAVFFYYQVRDGAVMSNFGFFLVSTQVVALTMALVLAEHSLKPILGAPPADTQAVEKPAPKPPARPPKAQPAEQPAEAAQPAEQPAAQPAEPPAEGAQPAEQPTAQ